MLRITEKNIKTEKWTHERPIKIALLGDPHMIWPWFTEKRLEKIVGITNELNPDVILLLGDYVGDHIFGKQLNAFEALRPLEKLTAKCGVYAVLGNHDSRRKERHIADWPQAMRESPIPLLENDSVEISCQGDKIFIAGIGDWWYGNPDIDKALEKTDKNSPIIFMTHNPDAFPWIPKHTVLTVAGHTHAGQVRLPFIGAVPQVIPSEHGARYAYGHIKENGKDLFVTAGLGMTGLPIRFLNKPEIALITLSQ